MSLVAPIDVVGSCYRNLAAVQNGNQAFWILVCQRAQQNGIHDAEERSVCADSQCERDHGNNGEPGRLQQVPSTIAKIFKQVIDPYERTRVTMEFFRLLHAAVRAAGGLPGLVERESAPFKILLQHRQVGVDLPSEVTFHASAPEQVRQLG